MIVGLVLGAAALLGCARAPGHVAQLEAATGAVEAQRGGAEATWAAAATGDRYAIGDAVRTGAAATARLRLRRGGELRLDPDTIVRFQRTPDRAHELDVDVEAGVVEIEAGDAEIVLDTAAGAARVERGASARVSAAAGRTRIEVLVGSVVIERGGATTTLAAGQRIEVDVGGVIIEDGTPAAARTPAIDAGAAPPGDDGGAPGDGDGDDGGDGGAAAAPLEVDVWLRAGESPVIHDPRPPTAVGIRFTCDGEGTVDIAGRKGYAPPAASATGRDAAAVPLGAGRHRYRVTCDGHALSSGTITVQRDAARKELPRAPPRNTLDADGRTYTVLYQNHLPELLLRWPDAPRGGGYELHVATGGKTRTIATREPRHTFTSGQLREGTHRWWFEGGGRRSPETSLKIDFDNAAAQVYLRAVERAGGAVRVEGAAVRDTTVTLGGARVELDQHQRFTAEGRPGPGERSVSLRIAHRGGGVHYYVLRTD